MMQIGGGIVTTNKSGSYLNSSKNIVCSRFNYLNKFSSTEPEFRNLPLSAAICSFPSLPLTPSKKYRL